MPYRPEHAAQTRARIVEAARRLFNRRGFEQVTIDQIMAAAGLTRGAFYHHFHSKNELYAAAVASFVTCNPFAIRTAHAAEQLRDPRRHSCEVLFNDHRPCQPMLSIKINFRFHWTRLRIVPGIA
jgi:AcrR family transcriptional regulator